MQYEYQKELKNNHLFFFREIFWSDISKCLLGDVGLLFKCKEKNNGPIGYCIYFRRPSQLLQLKYIIEIIKTREIPIEITELAEKRWLGLFRTFNYCDDDGLDVQYDRQGTPILKKGETLIEHGRCVPFVTMPVTFNNYFLLLTRHGELITPRGTKFYRTNRRMIFIRRIHWNDPIYRQFRDYSHICFYFRLGDAKKKERRNGDIEYAIKTDRRNRIRIVIPKDVAKYRKWYIDHQKKFKLMPEQPGPIASLFKTPESLDD